MNVPKEEELNIIRGKVNKLFSEIEGLTVPKKFEALDEIAVMPLKDAEKRINKWLDLEENRKQVKASEAQALKDIAKVVVHGIHEGRIILLTDLITDKRDEITLNEMTQEIQGEKINEKTEEFHKIIDKLTENLENKKKELEKLKKGFEALLEQVEKKSEREKEFVEKTKTTDSAVDELARQLEGSQFRGKPIDRKQIKSVADSISKQVRDSSGLIEQLSEVEVKLSTEQKLRQPVEMAADIEALRTKAQQSMVKSEGALAYA